MTRRILVISHERRPEAVEAADRVSAALRERGVEVGRDGDPRGAELVMVLGGDGTILRAAELAREEDIPLLGVNLGRVGFLAEAEPEALPEVVNRVVAQDYSVEERMTIDVQVTTPGGETHRGWAINEAGLEKGERSRMIETTVGVDGRGLSSFGCDALVLATPTGSTAYAFSGGGPVVWPDVEALLLVPVAAHALFAKPLVVGPRSVLEVELLPEYEAGESVGESSEADESATEAGGEAGASGRRGGEEAGRSGTGADAVLWCDGRRRIDVPPGSHITVRRGSQPVRLARLTEAPFSGRLVAKFDLPVQGWRGRSPGRSPA